MEPLVVNITVYGDVIYETGVGYLRPFDCRMYVYDNGDMDIFNTHISLQYRLTAFHSPPASLFFDRTTSHA